MLADPTGSETITSVRQPGRVDDFRPVPHGFSAGYTRAVHWLRFVLPAPPPDAHGLRQTLLEIHPPYLDDLRLYIIHPDEMEEARFGDRLPHAGRSHRAFLHPVLFADHRPVTVYLRLATSSSSLLVVRAWSPGDFMARSQIETGLVFALITFLLASIGANLWHGLWRRDAIYRDFLLYLLVQLLLCLGINGLVGQYLLPRHPWWTDQWVSITTILSITASANFYARALDIRHAARWMRWVYRIAFWASVLALPASLFGVYVEVITPLMFLGLLMLLTGTLRSLQLWRAHREGGRILLLAHLFSLGGVLSAVFTLLGLLPAQMMLVYGTQFGLVGSIAALQVLLARRIRAMERSQTELRVAAEGARVQAAQARAGREEQRQLLSMLVHEIKTPLAVIRLRLGARQPSAHLCGNADAAIGEIDGILSRCALAGRIEDGALACRPQAIAPGELLDQIAMGLSAGQRARLRPDGGEGLPTLHTDPQLLRVVLTNLIDNALKYSPPESTVSFRLSAVRRRQRDGLLFHTGSVVGSAGLPDAKRLFDKYYRAPAAHRLGGSGLGLYIVRALTERLGGTIEYLPDDGHIAFELWLPTNP